MERSTLQNDLLKDFVDPNLTTVADVADDKMN